MSRIEIGRDRYGYHRGQDGIPVRRADWVRGWRASVPSEHGIASALSLVVGRRIGHEITRAVRIALTESGRFIRARLSWV